MNKKILIIVCGLPGSGKTAVATKLAELTGATLIRTDVIRKELIKNPTYSKEELDFIREQTLVRAGKLLQNSESVILDSVFSVKRHREIAKTIAMNNNSPFNIIEVKCDESVLKTRITARSGDESGANFQVYQLYKNSFEPITEKHTVIDNSGTTDNTNKQIIDLYSNPL